MDNLGRKCFKCGRSPRDVLNLKLFRFPKAGSTNSFKCAMWAKYVFPEQQYNAIELHQKLHKDHRMLCQYHFRDEDFQDFSKQKLQRTSVPYFNEYETIENQLKELTENKLKPIEDSTCKLGKETDAGIDGEKTDSEVEIVCEKLEPGQEFTWEQPSVACDDEEALTVPDLPVTLLLETDQPALVDYMCNVCDEKIIGPRFVCCECENVAACARCEGAHARHLMLRVPPAAPEEEVRSVVEAARARLAALRGAGAARVKLEIKEEPPDAVSVSDSDAAIEMLTTVPETSTQKAGLNDKLETEDDNKLQNPFESGDKNILSDTKQTGINERFQYSKTGTKRILSGKDIGTNFTKLASETVCTPTRITKLLQRFKTGDATIKDLDENEKKTVLHPGIVKSILIDPTGGGNHILLTNTDETEIDSTTKINSQESDSKLSSRYRCQNIIKAIKVSKLHLDNNLICILKNNPKAKVQLDEKLLDIESSELLKVINEICLADSEVKQLYTVVVEADPSDDDIDDPILTEQLRKKSTSEAPTYYMVMRKRKKYYDE